jgi:hypothetical protein
MYNLILAYDYYMIIVQFYNFYKNDIWADLAHLMIGMSIILAKINVNFGQND